MSLNYYFDNDNFQHVENIMYDVVKQILKI